jgi:hypothetical protein
LLRPAPLRTGLARFPRIRLKQARADPLQQTPYVLLDGPPTDGVPVQGFVLRSVHHGVSGKHRRWLRRHGVQLALRFRLRCQCFHTGSPGPRQHPFGSGHSSRIRPVIPRTAGGGADPHALRFPAAFRLPALASRAIPYPPGNWAFLTVGLPDTTSCPDPDGVTTFHTCKMRPGRVPPISRGRRYSPGRYEVLDRRLPLFGGSAPIPRSNNPSARLSHNETSTEVHAIHPSSLALTCNPHGWNRDPWA